MSGTAFTKEEFALIRTVFERVNLPGSVAEMVVSIKAKCLESMKKKGDTDGPGNDH